MELPNRLQITEYEYTDGPCADMFLNLYLFYEKGIIVAPLDNSTVYYISFRIVLNSVTCKPGGNNLSNASAFLRAAVPTWWVCTQHPQVNDTTDDIQWIKKFTEIFPEKKSCIFRRIHDFELFTHVCFIYQRYNSAEVFYVSTIQT